MNQFTDFYKSYNDGKRKGARDTRFSELDNVANTMGLWRSRSFYEYGLIRESALEASGYLSGRDMYRYGKNLFSSADNLERNTFLAVREANQAARAGGATQGQIRRWNALTDARTLRSSVRALKSGGATVGSVGGVAWAGLQGAGKVLGFGFDIYGIAGVLGASYSAYKTSGAGAGIKTFGKEMAEWTVQTAAINLAGRNPYVLAAAGVASGLYLGYKAADAISEYGNTLRYRTKFVGDRTAFLTRNAATMRQQSANLLGDSGLAPRQYLGNEAVRLHA